MAKPRATAKKTSKPSKRPAKKAAAVEVRRGPRRPPQGPSDRPEYWIDKKRLPVLHALAAATLQALPVERRAALEAAANRWAERVFRAELWFGVLSGSWRGASGPAARARMLDESPLTEVSDEEVSAGTVLAAVRFFYLRDRCDGAELASVALDVPLEQAAALLAAAGAAWKSVPDRTRRVWVLSHVVKSNEPGVLAAAEAVVRAKLRAKLTP